ncbi:MAG: hypothetical protein ABI621_09950 [Chloroflexota bacterium]
MNKANVAGSIIYFSMMSLIDGTIFEPRKLLKKRRAHPYCLLSASAAFGVILEAI